MALAAGGVAAAVEERGRLAVLVAADETEARSIAAKRAWVVRTAATHGFSHVALEIAGVALDTTTARRDAAFSGD
jgi:hypothetical protein